MDANLFEEAARRGAQAYAQQVATGQRAAAARQIVAETSIRRRKLAATIRDTNARRRAS